MNAHGSAFFFLSYEEGYEAQINLTKARGQPSLIRQRFSAWSSSATPTLWNERVVRAFMVAASRPMKGYLARVLKEQDTVIGYAFASQRHGQLLVERPGVQPENCR